MPKSSVDLKKLLSQMTIDEKIGQLVELNAEFFIKSASEVTGPATSFPRLFDPCRSLSPLRR